MNQTKHIWEPYLVRAMRLQPLVDVFVSLTWCFSHFICSRGRISFLTPVCIFRAQDSDQFTARVNNYVLKWIVSSSSGPVCHCSLLVCLGGPAADSSPILVVRSWGEGIFWQLIIILGVFCLRVLVCWVFELGGNWRLDDNIYMNMYWEWCMFPALRWFCCEMCDLTNKKVNAFYVYLLGFKCSRKVSNNTPFVDILWINQDPDLYSMSRCFQNMINLEEQWVSVLQGQGYMMEFCFLKMEAALLAFLPA